MKLRCEHPLESLILQEEVRGWATSHEVTKGRVVHTNDEAVNCYTGRVRVRCTACRFDKIYARWDKLPERFRTVLGRLLDRGSGDVWDIEGEACRCVDGWSGQPIVVWRPGCQLHPTAQDL